MSIVHALKMGIHAALVWEVYDPFECHVKDQIFFHHLQLQDWALM